MTQQSELTVSIVIPVFNDPGGIADTLDSLLEQTVSDQLKEIVVVDNDSTDETATVVREYVAADSRVSIVFEREIQSSYAARNAGIQNSSGELLSFIDANMTVESHWLERALESLEASTASYMGCDVELTYPDSDPSFASRYDHCTGFPVEQYLLHQHFVPTCCLFVRREVFDAVGCFDHRLTSGGDKEFGNRVYDAGFEMHFAKDVTLYHPVRSSIVELVKKDLRVGCGHCQLQRFHPARFGKPGIPPRPSGIKSPDRSLSLYNRVTFDLVSKFLAGVRGLGYYWEFLSRKARGEYRDACESSFGH